MNRTRIYHVCLSSHEEVMFRSASDMIMGFNCLAAAAISTESRLLADGFMTTHYHFLVQTSSLKELLYRCRYSYVRYFNSKYQRKGRLGEHNFFILEVDGFHHTLAALNYVNRQGLHHGLAATPFGYLHCSANSYFRSDLGKNWSPPLLPDKYRNRYLPSNIKIPVKYRMSADGLLLREDVLDVAWVEQHYVNPKNFLFQMNRVADRNDIVNQEKENNYPPVTMETIEAGVPDFVLNEAKSNEYGKVNRSNMTDIELCSLIDDKLLPKIIKDGEKTSIYLLSETKREELCNRLWQKCCEGKWRKESKGIFTNKFVSEAQLCRCLCIMPSAAV